MFEVDVDQCKETAAGQGVARSYQAMPTFLFFRKKTKIGKLVSPDNKALEKKIVLFTEGKKRVGKKLAKEKKGESRTACKVFSVIGVITFNAFIVILYVVSWFGYI